MRFALDKDADKQKITQIGTGVLLIGMKKRYQPQSMDGFRWKMMKITKAWKRRLHWCRIFINRSGELNYVDTYFDNRSQNFLFSPLAEMASEAKM